MFLIDFHLFFLYLCTQGGGREFLLLERRRRRRRSRRKRILETENAEFAWVFLIYTRLHALPTTAECEGGELETAQRIFLFPSRAPAGWNKIKRKTFFIHFSISWKIIPQRFFFLLIEARRKWKNFFLLLFWEFLSTFIYFVLIKKWSLWCMREKLAGWGKSIRFMDSDKYNRIIIHLRPPTIQSSCLTIHKNFLSTRKRNLHMKSIQFQGKTLKRKTITHKSCQALFKLQTLHISLEFIRQTQANLLCWN